MKKTIYTIVLLVNVFWVIFLLVISYKEYNSYTKYVIEENAFYSRVNNYNKTELNVSYNLDDKGTKTYTYKVDDTIFELPIKEILKYENKPIESVRENGYYVSYDVNNPSNAIISLFLDSKNTSKTILSICELVFLPSIFLTIVVVLLKYRKKLIG